MTKQMNRFLVGAFLLTIAGIVSKALSAFYRIPLQNLTGDLGFYTYQQIYPIIATVMIVSLYGFPVAISRMTIEELKVNRVLSFRYFIIPMFLVLLFFCTLFASALFLMAPILSETMADSFLVRPLRLSASLFLFVPFLSLYRGLAQGKLQMEQVAYSQMIEQLLRVTIIILSAIFIGKGVLPVRSIAEAGIIASIIGMVGAIVLLVFFFVRDDFRLKSYGELVESFSVKKFIKTLFIFGIIASLNHLTLIFIQVIDAITLVPQLIKAGFTSIAAMEAKGVFDRGIPLIQFGAVLGSSFALALVPSLHEQMEEEDLHSIREALFVSMYVASAATIGLILLYEEINILLFKDSLGTTVLQILSLSILLLSLSITGNAILQGYGAVKWTVASLIIALFIKGILNYTFIPRWETYGSAIATVGSLASLTFLTLYGMHRYIPIAIVKGFPLFRLLLTNGILFFYVCMVKYFIKAPLQSRALLLLYVFVVVVSGAFIYFLGLIRYHLVNERQIAMFPFANQLMTLKERIQK